MTRTEILEVAKPILFNTEMVRAILNNEKSVTRRPAFPNKDLHEFKIKQYPNGWWFRGRAATSWDNILNCIESESPCKYKVGDYLYVRETWGISNFNYENSTAYIIYKASENEKEAGCQEIKLPQGKFDKLYESMAENSPDWRPCIHMPKEAARIFLRVTGVRVERLQNIITGDYRTPLNINKEGLILSCCFCTHHNGDCKDFIAQHSHKTLTCKLLEDYILLWNSTVKKSDLDKYGWDANPWVWVIEFERVEVEL